MPRLSSISTVIKFTNRVYSKEKTHINVVVIGHVDSGKSTTTGRKPSPLLSAQTIEPTARLHDTQI